MFCRWPGGHCIHQSDEKCTGGSSSSSEKHSSDCPLLAELTRAGVATGLGPLNAMEMRRNNRHHRGQLVALN